MKTCSFFLLLFLPIYSTWSANLHFLITTATDDETIGTSVEVDQKAMTNLAKKIATSTGLGLKLQVLTGSNFNVANFRALIQNLKVDANDVIFFYNSSHGYRLKQKSNKWPYIYIPDSPGQWDLAWIHDQLALKGARLTIVAGDQCNSFADQRNAPTDMPKEVPAERALPGEGKNLKALFLNAKGSIIATASKPGEYSWGDQKGGSFTRALIRSLLSNANNTNYSKWKDVFDVACKVQYVDGVKMSPQYAVFNLEEGPNTSEESPLLSYNYAEGNLRQTSKYTFTLNHNSNIYQLETYRPTTNRYYYLYDSFNGSWYSIDLIENDLWYWPKDGTAWSKWRELTPTGYAASLASYNIDGGSITQTGKSSWVMLWNNNRYDLEPYKPANAKYHYLYDKTKEDWYQLGLVDKKLWYWNKKTEAWEVWRNLTKK